MEELIQSLLDKETFDSFFSVDNDDPSHLLYGHTPSELEHAREVPARDEAVGGAGCSDRDMDRYLQQASEQYEENSLKSNSAQMPRFAVPKTEEEVQQARQARVPKKTQIDTRYCTKIWKNWSEYRNSVEKNELVPDDITMLNSEKLQYWLSRFVLEVRKKSGLEYPPNTLHHICCGLLRHLRENGRPEIDIFKEASFADFRATLDGEMKRLQSLGLGTKKRQAEPLTEAEENLLWSSGILGDHSPQALVDTIFFMNGIYFALRSGQEHRKLRSDPPQIELVEHPGERAYLQYREDISKNNPGGLKGRKLKPKVVIHHENTDDPSRCFVRLFKLYRSKCPTTQPKDAFYLQPLKKPTENCWYSPRPIGHCSLDNTVSRLCKSASIEGYKTNHSLRVTTATRLFQAGIDEQLIMERTGHHSTDGIRTYKRSSVQQQEQISDILALSKKPRVEYPQKSTAAGSSQALIPVQETIDSTCTVDRVQAQSNKQLVYKNESLHRMFNLEGCSGININVHIQ